MNASHERSGLSTARSRREVIDIPEPRKKDRSVDKLLDVHRQRLDRLERERIGARHTWRESRLQLREAKKRWREAAQAATDYWQQSRAEFYRMTITSGQFRKAKAVYDRMKMQAAQLRLECREVVKTCKGARAAFFEARQRALNANRHVEKLGILRDEMRLQMMEKEL